MSQFLKMSEDDYRSIKALNQSRLSLFSKSPLHYKAYDESKEPTKEQRFGTLFHMALLEPSRFKQAYAVEPEFMPDGEPINRRMKKHREHLGFWAKENAGKIHTSKDDLERITDMLAQLSIDELAISHFRTDTTEAVSVWDFNGRQCKARADAVIDIPGLGRTVVDLKTTADASEKGFEKSIYNYCYYLQAYWYLEAFKAQSFVFVAIETKPPYAIGVYQCSDGVLELGRQSADKWMKYLNWCEENNKWPGYTRERGLIGLPAWAPAEQETLNNEGEI